LHPVSQSRSAEALGGGISQQNQNIAGTYNNIANAGTYLLGKSLGADDGGGGYERPSTTPDGRTIQYQE